ncbi:hypothetical protein M885DRAFT_541275 [Pelagophyceae sp. CCMP2097]|nr:hypothetical protein M885DRAFT_541275 [Pelagophyceae sp. CCMP2097]
MLPMAAKHAPSSAFGAAFAALKTRAPAARPVAAQGMKRPAAYPAPAYTAARGAPARAAARGPVDLLAQGLSGGSAPAAKRMRTSALEKPVASFIATDDDDAPSARVGAPAESRVFGAMQARAPRANVKVKQNLGGEQTLPYAAAPARPVRRPAAAPARPHAGAARGTFAPKATGLAHDVPLDAETLAALRSSKSRHAESATNEKAKTALRTLAQLERREFASDAAAAASVRAVTVRCFSCADCNKVTEDRPMQCVAAKHRVSAAFAKKRTFVCGGCAATKAALGHVPNKPCLKCGSDTWTVLRASETRRIAAGPEAAFRPALAEWTSQADLRAEVFAKPSAADGRGAT